MASLKWKLEIVQSQQSWFNLEIKLLDISLAATLTNNSYFIYEEKLFRTHFMLLNLVYNQNKLQPFMRSFTQQLQGLKFDSNIELKTQVL